MGHLPRTCIPATMYKTGALMFSLFLLCSVLIENAAGIKCLQCATADPNNTPEEIESCATGVNLEETDCESAGWGSECITRVFINSETGAELFLRSCLAPSPMTCDEGHAEYGENSEYYTHCCDADGCNNYDPREAFEDDDTTTEGPGIMCYRCASNHPDNTEEDTQACITGEGLEDTALDCPNSGWGERCIAQVYRLGTSQDMTYVRSCLAPDPMVCNEGYTNYGESGELWTYCCDDDHCNGEDPLQIVSTPEPQTQCFRCASNHPDNTDEDTANCISGNNLEATSMNCEENGWGSQCIARVYRLGSDENREIYLRSCVAPSPMTCEEGYESYGNSGEVWTVCCEGDNCNDYDPKAYLSSPDAPITTTEPEGPGIMCYRCASNHPDNTEEETQACITGDGLEDTALDCPNSGWGERCIAQVYRLGPSQTMTYVRSCLAPDPMVCNEGYTNYGEA